jgi:hypothetical protein
VQVFLLVERHRYVFAEPDGASTHQAPSVDRTERAEGAVVTPGPPATVRPPPSESAYAPQAFGADAAIVE